MKKRLPFCQQTDHWIVMWLKCKGFSVIFKQFTCNKIKGVLQISTPRPVCERYWLATQQTLWGRVLFQTRGVRSTNAANALEA